MWTDQALLKLSNKSSYCREDLFHILSSEKTNRYIQRNSGCRELNRIPLCLQAAG